MDSVNIFPREEADVYQVVTKTTNYLEKTGVLKQKSVVTNVVDNAREIMEATPSRSIRKLHEVNQEIN
jgi:hypothetical protein